MKCPYCQNFDTSVIDTTKDKHGGVRRRRRCDACNQRFSTYERPILTTPLLIKRDGTREQFDRENYWQGLRMACRSDLFQLPVSKELMTSKLTSERGRSEVNSCMLAICGKGAGN